MLLVRSLYKTDVTCTTNQQSTINQENDQSSSESKLVPWNITLSTFRNIETKIWQHSFWDDDWCFTVTFVHMVGQMGRATSKGNEAKSKMKQSSDMPTLRFELGGTGQTCYQLDHVWPLSGITQGNKYNKHRYVLDSNPQPGGLQCSALMTVPSGWPLRVDQK